MKSQSWLHKNECLSGISESISYSFSPHKTHALGAQNGIKSLDICAYL